MDLALNSEISYISQLSFGNCSLYLITISLESDRDSEPHDIFDYISGIGPSPATDTSREIELY